MRYIDPVLKARIEKANQTLYENANPAMMALISRRSIPISDKAFLERTKIGDYTNASGASIATRRPIINKQADRIYAAFCSAGVGRVVYTDQKVAMPSHIWLATENIPDAVDIAITFDGKMVKDLKGKVQFITKDENPWVFWIDSIGAMYGKLIGDESTLVALASANVTAVAAIRSVQSSIVEADQGLLVFYIVNGVVYYNSILNGVWSGQSTVDLVPTNAVSIRVGRTWDYRIVLQIKDQNGILYETFSKMMASGWVGVDHVFAEASAKVDVYEVTYYDLKSTDESIFAALSTTVVALWAIDEIMIEAYNTVTTAEDPENPGVFRDDYGYKVRVIWDHGINTIVGNEPNFMMKDSTNALFGVTAITIIDDKEIELTFQNFNNAVGDVTITYTPGTILGEAGQSIITCSINFTPTGLIPFAVSPPAPISAENIIDWEAMA